MRDGITFLWYNGNVIRYYKYMGLFFPSKKPTVSGAVGGKSVAHSLDRNSRGRITPRELPLVEKKLKEEMGHYKAEKIMEGLHPNMDSDGRLGGSNISAKEGSDTLDYLKKGRYNNLSSMDIKKAKDILGEFQ
ncbi:MAG: hypothetical protein COZ29_01120 [Candidatus Moranbacteria bacterium CG_4_10_14_3_um_filter_45_9]|nr:MAG: hypothetical protein AUK19_00710 [Candidatus Moranbacteria bacterium CG2_30_45_14]PIX90226.1 MAG: hypothetical protein COZ29_01120 [Candidatus Moranbacteria bacterium CG_4_10_14_3_um_filter_45_9]PJA85038.1 MAG: hypothetical protein CO143_03295 [Candidatus Moranbacteria bacterium CG_4_9_14_3_um_filter_45_14]